MNFAKIGANARQHCIVRYHIYIFIVKKLVVDGLPDFQNLPPLSCKFRFSDQGGNPSGETPLPLHFNATQLRYTITQLSCKAPYFCFFMTDTDLQHSSHSHTEPAPKQPHHETLSTGVLGWSAWQRVLAVLPLLALLWLAVWWAHTPW